MKGKQRRFLQAQASTMNAVIQIGKNGLEESVKRSALEAITKRELIKVKILQNAFVDEKETFYELADYLDADLIQIIGKNGIFFKQKEDSSYELPQ